MTRRLLLFIVLLILLGTGFLVFGEKTYAAVGDQCLYCPVGHLEGTSCIPMYGGLPMNPQTIVCTSNYPFCKNGTGCCKSDSSSDCTTTPSGGTLPNCTSPGTCDHSDKVRCDLGYTDFQGKCSNNNVCCQQNSGDIRQKYIGASVNSCPQCSSGCTWSGSTNTCVPIYTKSHVNCSVVNRLDCSNRDGICFAGCGCALSDCTGNDLGFGQLCNEGKSCDTALGTISTTNVSSFSSTVFGILLGIAGGIAVLLIIISGYRIMTSQGNPEVLQRAREQFTAAIVGLLFIIFSFVILEVIGVNILHIPGIGQ